MCSSCEWELAADQANEMLDDDSLEFAYSTIEGIRNWIEQSEHVTEAQQSALDNIQEKSRAE
jgi:hypothetical protein